MGAGGGEKGRGWDGVGEECNPRLPRPRARTPPRRDRRTEAHAHGGAMQLVVETGIPLRAAMSTVMAAPSSMEEPREGE